METACRSDCGWAGQSGTAERSRDGGPPEDDRTEGAVRAQRSPPPMRPGASHHHGRSPAGHRRPASSGCRSAAAGAVVRSGRPRRWPRSHCERGASVAVHGPHPLRSRPRASRGAVRAGRRERAPRPPQNRCPRAAPARPLRLRAGCPAVGARSNRRSASACAASANAPRPPVTARRFCPARRRSPAAVRQRRSTGAGWAEAGRLGRRHRRSSGSRATPSGTKPAASSTSARPSRRTRRPRSRNARLP